MALLLRFCLFEDNYHFRIGDGGDPEEFDRAVELIKQWIPLKERRWDGKFWQVKATKENENKLAAIFENGRKCINRTSKSGEQLRLF